MIRGNIRYSWRFWQPFAAVLLLSFAMPASAGIQEIRVVGIGVDSSSMQAQQKAFDYARRRAVYLAARKLGVADATKMVGKFTPQQFSQIIRGANVTQVKRQGDITYSEVIVTIVEEPLRRALKLADLPSDAALAGKTNERGVLLLSVFVGAERAYMWEKENEIRAPLSDEIRRQARGGILLPGGDLEDLRLIDYQNALTVKAEDLKPMYARYGAEEIIIAIVTPGAAGTMSPSSILLRRLRLDQSRNEVMEVPPELPEEPMQVRVLKAAAAITTAATQIATSTAERDREMRAKAKRIAVRFSYAVPQDFARMQAAVRVSPEVLALELPSIALAQVDGTIYLKGEAESLKQTLAKQGVIVTPLRDGWRLAVR